MQRACFRLRVDPGSIPEYRARHAAVWPEMLAALKDAGWDNYSLFLADDGTLIGYVEATDDIASAQQRMQLTEVNTRWQAEMSRLFADLGGSTPDESFELVAEIFHLEDQLETSQTEHHTKGAEQ